MNLPAAHSTLDTIYTRYDGLRGFGDTTGKIFEAIITSLYRILLQPGDVALDLGACTGLHTVPLGQCVGPRGLVVGFEPLPDCRTRLEANCRSAGVLPQVQIQSTALSKQKGTATFFASLPRLLPTGTGDGDHRRVDHGRALQHRRPCLVRYHEVAFARGAEAPVPGLPASVRAAVRPVCNQAWAVAKLRRALGPMS